MASFFSLPNELMLATLSSRFPCRNQQIRSLATLLPINRNLVIHGLEATGKSAITRAVLEGLSTPEINSDDDEIAPQEIIRYTIVKSAECISGRHLLEQTVGSIAKATNWEGYVARCENLAQLVVEVEKLLARWSASEEGAKRFVLVFDGIDHQRDAPSTLFPALARLVEFIPNLTTVFIVTSPHPNFLHSSGIPHVEFPTYTKPQLLQILSLNHPEPELPSGEKDTKETWSRFCSAVWDSLSKHSGRDMLSFQDVCIRLWPRFIRPILDNSMSPSPFSKLLLANRSLFQDDSVLVPSIVSDPAGPVSTLATSTQKYQGIGAQLPYFSRVLLIAAYLASFNAPRTDQLYFMKAAAAKRRKKGGGTALTRASKPGVSKSRKIARKLLGPQAFVLERMMAIFHAIREDSGNEGRYLKRRGNGEALNGSADLQMAVATLVSLRLVIRVGGAGGDVLDAACKYRVAVGWEVVRGLGRSVGVEVEDYLAE